MSHGTRTVTAQSLAIAGCYRRYRCNRKKWLILKSAALNALPGVHVQTARSGGYLDAF